MISPRYQHGPRLLISNPLDFIERDLVAAAIIKSCSPSRFMAGHVLGDLQLTAVLQVRGDPGSAEAVGADLGAQPCSSRPPLNHHVHVGLGSGVRSVSRHDAAVVRSGNEHARSGSSITEKEIIGRPGVKPARGPSRKVIATACIRL